MSSGRYLTALADANFFSVAMTAPLRWAALSADLPFTTVSRGPPPAPRVRLPILVTLSQSSDMFAVVCGVEEGWVCVCGGVREAEDVLSCADGGVVAAYIVAVAFAS
jgi:hypothetical protein